MLYLPAGLKSDSLLVDELPPLPTNVQAGCARSLPVASIGSDCHSIRKQLEHQLPQPDIG